ncbi:MAG: YARHG domain-containing protein [Eubacteriales bacterium]|nr:YARHG domain-containing protein [Eubacteriales bacterium]MDD3880860.1 YARHG domain-containing protein [Eubacteriales bacterium]MDD4511773.1 YARHG domain-containing protein [Eubacteriales bacterium]
MKKLIIALLVIAIMLPSAALAGRQYIVPDSDTRELTYEELWEWNYESLGFIFNEIFARHGYNFIVGGKYYNYFTSRPWYTPNANSDNSKACYPKLNATEWYNEALIKEVRADMRLLEVRDEEGKNYLDYIESGEIDVLSGFRYSEMKANQKLDVYSAPDYSSYRGANGKALVNTNGSVYVAGWENGWLLIMYETNNGSVRVGYVDGAKVKGTVNAPMLTFAYTSVKCLEDAALTDDPAAAFSTIVTIPKNSVVTYLSEYQNRYGWAYVETKVGNQTVRGFVRTEKLELDTTLDENEDASLG